jgi:hypothetical protein
MNEDMEKRVGQYVAVRDEIDALKLKHEEELRKPKLILEKLAGIIHKFLDDNNLENLRTSAGSCYISTRWTATVQDPDAFMQFVISSQNFDLLERRAKAEAVKAYVNEHNILPTGVNLNALSSVGVRRPSGKSKS